ncbi:hypothetical protein HHUSO_G9716 [Huso huso]|uniref:Uncharacterized protein n=2 Tax=Acipenseridae TaxID=7900 RepID=A0ABR0ZV79_HUSHU|nr:uncharacterized protein LOC131737653 isoform X2 [Acipenser ruthenus]
MDPPSDTAGMDTEAQALRVHFRVDEEPLQLDPLPGLKLPSIREKQEGQVCLLDEQRRQEEYYLLAELTRFEEEIRARSWKERERQEALQRKRFEENQERWKSLHNITLSQRLNKPWVFSFFTNIPMHIYCQPIRKPPKARRARNWR